MKRIFGILTILLLTISLIGCTKKEEQIDNTEALKFKEEYESLNGKETSYKTIHREITISDDNPFITVDEDEIVNLINNKETFYVYFGFPECPWCRSVLESFIKVSKDNKIEKVYYVNVKEIRDTLELNKGKTKKTKEGTEGYYKLLELLGNVLSDYKLTDNNGKVVKTNEKRIYAPNFIYVEKGKATKITQGISEKQTDSNMDLSKEIISDQEKIFKDFLTN